MIAFFQDVSQVADLGEWIAGDIDDPFRLQRGAGIEERRGAAISGRIQDDGVVMRMPLAFCHDEAGGVRADETGIADLVAAGVFPGILHGLFVDLDAGQRADGIGDA